MSALNQLKQQDSRNWRFHSRAQLEEASLHGRIDSPQPPLLLVLAASERDASSYCIEKQYIQFFTSFSSRIVDWKNLVLVINSTQQITVLKRAFPRRNYERECCLKNSSDC